MKRAVPVLFGLTVGYILALVTIPHEVDAFWAWVRRIIE